MGSFALCTLFRIFFYQWNECTPHKATYQSRIELEVATWWSSNKVWLNVHECHWDCQKGHELEEICRNGHSQWLPLNKVGGTYFTHNPYSNNQGGSPLISLIMRQKAWFIVKHKKILREQTPSNLECSQTQKNESIVCGLFWALPTPHMYFRLFDRTWDHLISFTTANSCIFVISSFKLGVEVHKCVNFKLNMYWYLCFEHIV